MEYALKKFKKRIEFIQKQIHSQGLAKELRNVFGKKELNEEEINLLNEIRANKTDEKLYQYTANVISLYGGLESFIESIAEEYLKELSSHFPSYKALKDVTGIGDYMSTGTSLLSHAEERKFKNLAKKDVLKGMYGAIVNDDSRALHSEAFIDFGGGNYRHETIMKCFLQLGAKEMPGKLKGFEPLQSYIVAKGIDASSNIYTKVDDLVERRNELAHGTEAPELMDAESFSEYLSFFSIYAEAINNYLNNELKSYDWEQVNSEVVEPRVYSNNVISLKDEQVVVGAEFVKGKKIMILRNGLYYDGEIDNIRVNEIDYDFFRKENVGVEIGLKVKTICIITKECKIKIVL